MANHKSAIKRARQTKKRTAVNKSRVSRVRTEVRKVEEAIKAGDKKAAATLLRTAESALKKAASKGITHKNAASRKVSRLNARIKKLAN